MFTEYQIRAAFIDTIKEALEDLGIEGWKVQARNAQVITSGNKVILVDRLFTRRVGFQGRQYVKSETALKEIEEWIEDITWQISVIRKRKVSDDINTVTGLDISKRLIGWLNSGRGADAMRGRSDVPFAPIFCRESSQKRYEDDSDINQYEASFDFRMEVLQILDFDSPVIKALDIETYPI